MSSIQMAEEFLNPTNIKVVGIGGAGCNAINRMIDNGFEGVEFIALNTDVQSLNVNKAQHKIQIGAQITKGLGTGANPELGEKAALESKESIKEALSGANMVFITAGMGGGTGTGAAPIVAQISKELGILTVAVVTKPFDFEGKKRIGKALEGISRFDGSVDSIIVVSNQKLLTNLDDTTLPLVSAFEKVDEVLMQGVRGIADIINKTGVVNVDFADVKVIMQGAGKSIMGFGVGIGKDRALSAVKTALINPLLDIDIRGAKGILVNLSGGKSLSLLEYNQVVEYISEQAHEDANIIAGAYIDDHYEEQIQVTVIATAFDEAKQKEVQEIDILKQVEKEEMLIKKAEEILEETKKNKIIHEEIKNHDYDNNEDSLFTKRDIYKILDEDFLTLSKLEIPAYQRKRI